MKCPECGREMADGYVKSSAFGDIFNLKNGLEWYPAEDKRKLFKLNSITLKTKGKDLDIYARKSAEALGIVMEELAEWQCCGAVYPLATDEIATKLSAVEHWQMLRKKDSLWLLCVLPAIMSLRELTMT